MQINVEQVAELLHNVNKVFCEYLGEKQPDWKDAPEWMKESISNGIKNYFQKDGKLTPEQSHENWMHEKLKNGWKYGAKKSEIKKTHPCMVPYKHLPEAQKVKDKLFLTIVETMQKW